MATSGTRTIITRRFVVCLANDVAHKIAPSPRMHPQRRGKVQLLKQVSFSSEVRTLLRLQRREATVAVMVI